MMRLRLLNNIRRLFRKRGRFDEKSLSASVSQPRFYATSNEYRNFAWLRNYERIYLTDGVVFSCINSLARYVASTDWDISYSDPDVKQIVQDFIDNTMFDRKMLTMVRHVLIYGDAFIEKVMNAKGELADLVLCDPKTIEIGVNEYGEPEMYVQRVGNKEIIFEPEEEMIQLNFYDIPGSPYGASVVGVNYDIIVKKIKVDEAIAAAILHHGFPKFHVSVGSASEDIIPSKEVIDDIASKFKDINSKSEFVTPDLIQIKNIDAKGIEHIEDYTSYFLNLLTAGFSVPEEQLGLGKGSTEASGKVRQALFERTVRTMQSQLETFVSRKIFDVITSPYGGSAQLQFRDISPIDEAMIIKWVEPLLKTDEGTFAILARNEIRRLFNLPVTEDE